MQERLQKIIAQAGLASRREAEDMIRDGRVSVNDQVITKLGTKADAEKDNIRVDGRLIHGSAEKIYLMLNKPRGYVTTLHDPQQRPIVTDLLTDVSARVFPVGRLDYDSQGLLLMTNDGEFAQQILHPRFRMSKVYRVKIRGKLSVAEQRTLKKGIILEDGEFKPLDIQVTRINEKSSWLSLTLNEGRNRIIRRALAFLGREVEELIRIRIGKIELGNLKTGQYRFLKKSEWREIILPKQENQ